MSIQLSKNTTITAKAIEEDEREDKRRKRLLLLLMLLLALLACVVTLFIRYLWQPVPLPELLPIPVNVNYAPHYLFSIYEIERPIGVAVSPDGDRIYVAETGGERLVKVFDRDGDLLNSFAPPRTRPGERSPVYVTTDKTGRVYVTDRLQHAVFVYDELGTYLDTILGPDLTLSEYVSKHVGSLPPGTVLAYNSFEPDAYYQIGETEQTIPAPSPVGWAPLGIRMDSAGNMLLTDVAADRHTVREISGDVLLSASWQDFAPPENIFGAYGQGDGQLLFPNTAVAGSRGRVYVTDGNNGRISVWDGEGNFLFHFGQGSGDGALSLPRGAVIDSRDRLHVVDAVGQDIKVYDVSGSEISLLFAFGDWGMGDGQFNYPSDIALDATGRVYVADRENNRIQIWSY